MSKKIPLLSSREFVKLLAKGNARYVRQTLLAGYLRLPQDLGYEVGVDILTVMGVRNNDEGHPSDHVLMFLARKRPNEAELLQPPD